MCGEREIEREKRTHRAVEELQEAELTGAAHKPTTLATLGRVLCSWPAMVLVERAPRSLLASAPPAAAPDPTPPMLRPWAPAAKLRRPCFSASWPASACPPPLDAPLLPSRTFLCTALTPLLLRLRASSRTLKWMRLGCCSRKTASCHLFLARSQLRRGATDVLPPGPDETKALPRAASADC